MSPNLIQDRKNSFFFIDYSSLGRHLQSPAKLSRPRFRFWAGFGATLVALALPPASSLRAASEQVPDAALSRIPEALPGAAPFAPSLRQIGRAHV